MKELKLRHTKMESTGVGTKNEGTPETDVTPRQNMYISTPTTTSGDGRNTKVTNEDTTGQQNSTVHGNDAGIKGSTMRTTVPTIPRSAEDDAPLQMELKQVLSTEQLRKWHSICEQ